MEEIYINFAVWSVELACSYSRERHSFLAGKQVNYFNEHIFKDTFWHFRGHSTVTQGNCTREQPFARASPAWEKVAVNLSDNCDHLRGITARTAKERTVTLIKSYITDDNKLKRR